jgi:hypothetical protein
MRLIGEDNAFKGKRAKIDKPAKHDCVICWYNSKIEI